MNNYKMKNTQKTYKPQTKTIQIDEDDSNEVIGV